MKKLTLVILFILLIGGTAGAYFMLKHYQQAPTNIQGAANKPAAGVVTQDSDSKNLPSKNSPTNNTNPTPEQRNAKCAGNVSGVSC
jgi:hypothetical protein